MAASTYLKNRRDPRRIPVGSPPVSRNTGNPPYSDVPRDCRGAPSVRAAGTAGTQSDGGFTREPPPSPGGSAPLPLSAGARHPLELADSVSSVNTQQGYLALRNYVFQPGGPASPSMTSLINSTQSALQTTYEYYLWTLSLSDDRTKGWLLVDSPVPTILYTMLYLAIVWAGPRLMKQRSAFRLTWLLVPYNLAMAALNAYIAVQLLTASWRLRYSYICEPCRQKYDADEMQIANAVWWYYFSKLLEFCDTFFFILRKKDEQLTFLHVYHHSSMFSFWWIGIKWVPSGSTFLPAMVNSGIHVLMYTYYGLSVFGPSVSKYLWWKKYLTILQLIQFTCALILGINGLRTGCEFPLWMHYTLIIYMISFIVLFGKFYLRAYMESGGKALEVRYGQKYQELSQDNKEKSYSYNKAKLQ